MSPTTSAERAELDRRLIETGRGDRQAFAELYERTSSKLYGVCLRMLRDRSEADEVLQEIYTTVWRRAASFDAAKAGAITWLIALARNKSIDRLRQRREAQSEDPFMLDVMDADQTTPAAAAESSQEYRRLENCLDELQPQQRNSVREAFYGGATYNELAKRCKVPLGTMKTWIRRSLMQLRACLDR